MSNVLTAGTDRFGAWLHIFRGLWLSIDVSKVFLGSLGVALSLGWIWLLAHVSGYGRALAFWDGLVSVPGPVELLQLFGMTLVDWIRDLRSGAIPFLKALLVSSVVSLGLLAIWSLFGGAICRMAAVEFARGEPIPQGRALRFARRRWLSCFAGPFVPVAAFLLIALLGVAAGFAGNIPGAGPFLVAAWAPIGLVLGLLAAFLAAGLAFGFYLMIPAVFVEGRDVFDSIQSLHYVYERPWLYVVSRAILFVYGVVSVLVVVSLALFGAELAILFCRGGDIQSPDIPGLLHHAPAFLGGVLKEAPQGFPAEAAAVAVGVILWAFVIALAGFAAAYAFCVRTVLYFVIRRLSSAEVPFSEIYIEEEAHPAPPPVPTAPGTESPVVPPLPSPPSLSLPDGT